MNIYFGNPLLSLTKQTSTTLSPYNLAQVINQPIQKCGHISDWVVARTDDDIRKKYTLTDTLQSDYYCIKSYFNVSVSMPSTIFRTAMNMANIDRLSFIVELSSVSEFSSVEKAKQYCDIMRNVIDKHAPPSLRKVTNHNSSHGLSQ